MSIIVFCALLGLVLDGVRGLLIGVLLGYGAQWAFAPILRSRLQQGQARFLDSTFAMMGLGLVGSNLGTQGIPILGAKRHACYTSQHISIRLLV